MSSRSGAYVRSTVLGEPVRCFLPSPLPPSPPLVLDTADQQLLGRADRALGRLDGCSSLLPDPALLVYMYVRKEAVLSSQIEGTQSSLSDLLQHEADGAPGTPLDDVVEVSNYARALDFGIRRMREGFPLSLRLLREIHEVLLSRGRGDDKEPGEFRRSQNWVGGSRPSLAQFVPPPPERLMECLDPFEKFLHDDPASVPLLVKAALAHAQFETIHPFLDGNGRLGRLLITLLLVAEGALSEPILYLSLFFKTHRAEYYERLQRVRTHGEWEEWTRFFLKGIDETAEQATRTARLTLELFERDRATIRGLGKAGHAALTVHDELRRHPVVPIRKMAELTAMTEPGVTNVFYRLRDLGVLREITGRKRDRVFAYGPYLDLLSEGTEPIA